MFDFFKKKRPPSSGPDYSNVDSRQKAHELARAGDFVAIQLLPAIFGGDDSAPNVLYVPQFVADLKDEIDSGTVMRLVEQGKVTRYQATPKYQGKSVVPMSIEISAYEPANFMASIAIWGDALEANQPEKT